MTYLRYTLMLVGSTWSLLAAAQPFPSLSELSEQQAAQRIDSLLNHVNTYDGSEQGAVYDSLEYLANYFRLDTFRTQIYLKRGRYALFHQSNAKQALQYFRNAQELAIEADDSSRELDALVQIAQLYNHTGITGKTIEAILALKKRAEEIGDSTNISAAYFLLGQADVAITDYSVSMFRRSLAYFNRPGGNRIRIYANLGQAYMAKESPNLDSARHFLELAKALNDSVRREASVDNTLAEVYMKQGHYARAEALLRQIIEDGSYGGYDYTLLTYRLMLQVLQRRRQPAAAQPYVEEGLTKMAINYYDDYEVVDFCRAAKVSAAALDDFSTYQALDSIEQAATDSIQTYTENASVSQSEFAYQLDQMEATLSDKESLLQNRNIIIAILGGGLLLSGLLVYQIYHRRQLVVRQRTTNQQLFRLEGTVAETLQQQERQLSAYVVSLMHKNSILSRVLDKLKSLNGQVHDGEVDQLVKLMEGDLKNEDQWKKFLAHFENVHPDFYRTLDERYPNLTKQDKRIMAYLKMELTTKEIAQLLGVNYESVNTSRYRIRKKMDLPKETELDSFIARL